MLRQASGRSNLMAWWTVGLHGREARSRDATQDLSQPCPGKFHCDEERSVVAALQ